MAGQMPLKVLKKGKKAAALPSLSPSILHIGGLSRVELDKNMTGVAWQAEQDPITHYETKNVPLHWPAVIKKHPSRILVMMLLFPLSFSKHLPPVCLVASNQAAV